MSRSSDPLWLRGKNVLRGWWSGVLRWLVLLPLTLLFLPRWWVVWVFLGLFFYGVAAVAQLIVYVVPRAENGAVRVLDATLGRVPFIPRWCVTPVALVREAVNIVQEGIADAEAVDLVAKNGFGIRMPAYGIFEHQDIVGLDMGVTIVDYVTRDLNNEPRAPELMRELVREGKLGAKTGRGFYDWSSKSADSVRARRDAFLVEVLRYRRQQRQE